MTWQGELLPIFIFWDVDGDKTEISMKPELFNETVGRGEATRRDVCLQKQPHSELPRPYYVFG